MVAVGYHIKGLRELDRALGRADKTLRREMRDSFRDIAVEVAAEARSIASQRTITRTGDLIQGIQPYSLSGRAGVRSGAMHGGYPYPKRLEFEGRRGGVHGPRASLYPAVFVKKPRIREGIDRAMDRMERTFHGRMI